ncbi:MAG: prolipoprotein diacylglyceryl transferase [Candidatus Peregrinibacteria bacterium]
MIDWFPSRAVAVSLFGFSVHWYGLLYMVAFILAYVLLPRLKRAPSEDITADDWASILSFSVIGVLVGGRLGFVLFYEPAYFLAHPLEILMVWRGGMSSHGGFLGVVIAILAVCRKRGLDPFVVADRVSIPAAIGLSFGRVGNFINQELYGTVTTLPWGISIPGVEGLRHPVQIYAIIKDLFIALMCFLYFKRSDERHSGRTFALFLMLYGVLRFITEYFRDQPYASFSIGSVMFTRGQLLTIPIVLAGVILWWWMGRRAR